MAISNINRTLGDIGKYVGMDLAHVFGAAGAVFVGSNVSDGVGIKSLNGRNTTGAAASFAIALLLLYFAGDSSEDTGDYLAPAALGALLTSVAFLVDREWVTNGSSSSRPRTRARSSGCTDCGPSRARSGRTQTAGQYAPTPSPRRDQIRRDYENETWG